MQADESKSELIAFLQAANLVRLLSSFFGLFAVFCGAVYFVLDIKPHFARIEESTIKLGTLSGDIRKEFDLHVRETAVRAARLEVVEKEIERLRRRMDRDEDNGVYLRSIRTKDGR